MLRVLSQVRLYISTEMHVVYELAIGVYHTQYGSFSQERYLELAVLLVLLSSPFTKIPIHGMRVKL